MPIWVTGRLSWPPRSELAARAVFALDISNPRCLRPNDVMWEFNSSLDADMGQFVGRPYMGITEGGQWVAAFGNGLNSAQSTRNSVYH